MFRLLFEIVFHLMRCGSPLSTRLSLCTESLCSKTMHFRHCWFTHLNTYYTYEMCSRRIHTEIEYGKRPEGRAVYTSINEKLILLLQRVRVEGKTL